MHAAIFSQSNVLMVALLAVGFSGLLYQVQSSDRNFYLLLGAWIFIGEAMLVPFWRPNWVTFAGIAFGVWIGFVLFGVHAMLMLFNSR